MTAHDVAMASRSQIDDRRNRPVRTLDSASILQLARRHVVFMPNGAQIAALMETARKGIPMLTSAETVHRVVSHNPDSFWAITRREKFDINAPVAEGYCAFLPLKKEGLRRLLDGSLDRRNPPLELIAAQNEKPAGVYIWHTHAPGHLSVVIPLACQKLWGLHSQDIDIYSWTINDAAAKFAEGIGFRRMPKIEGSNAPQFHVFRRSPKQPLRIVDVHVPADHTLSPRLSVQVARGVDDFMRAVAIRGAVYLGEQECPYDEEFDGNDFSATHLIGYVGNEPAGCLRVRYFGDFAKVERLVVRKEFRSSGLARHIVAAGVDLCRRKGYERVSVYSQKRLTRFWAKCGFVLPEQPRELVFSDFDYVEMINTGQKPDNVISTVTDPYMIVRPEGEWDHTGILERSITRGIRRPSAEEVAA